MADCLHCDINDLVQERVDAGETNFGDLAAMMVESLVELIMLAPEPERAALMADAIGHFGNTYLEKTGVNPEGSSATH